MIQQPLVSIIVPCYNQAQYLPDALKSVLAQTYPHWECIVVNDGSSDNTIQVALRFAKKDSRIHLVNVPENCGLAASRNKGIKNCSGEFILPLDADDMIIESYLETTIPHLVNNKNLRLVFTDTKCFGKQDVILRFRHFNLSELCNENQLNCTALYRRQDYERTQGYRSNMVYGYEDWDFWLQLLTSEKQIHHIQVPMLLVRVKDNAMHVFLTQDIQKERAMRQQLKINNPTFFIRHGRKKEALISRIVHRFKKTLGFSKLTSTE